MLLESWSEECIPALMEYLKSQLIIDTNQAAICCENEIFSNGNPSLEFTLSDSSFPLIKMQYYKMSWKWWLLEYKKKSFSKWSVSFESDFAKEK